MKLFAALMLVWFVGVVQAVCCEIFTRPAGQNVPLRTAIWHGAQFVSVIFAILAVLIWLAER